MLSPKGGSRQPCRQDRFLTNATARPGVRQVRGHRLCEAARGLTRHGDSARFAARRGPGCVGSTHRLSSSGRGPAQGCGRANCALLVPLARQSPGSPHDRDPDENGGIRRFESCRARQNTPHTAPLAAGVVEQSDLPDPMPQIVTAAPIWIKRVVCTRASPARVLKTH